MTRDERNDRIRRSWAEVRAKGGAVGPRFYARLFALAPEARPLFRGDPAFQAEKLTATLSFVVEHLDDEARLRREAAALGRRHRAYEVEAMHYASAGEALLGALRETLGAARFDEATRDAWAAAYAELCAIMLAAAAEED